MLSDAEWEALRLSALVGVGATALVMPPAIVLGRVLAVASFRGKALVETVLLLPLVLPPVVTGYGLLVLFGRRGPLGPALAAIGLPVVFTWRACVIASAVMAFPLAYRACRTAFEAVDQRIPGVARTLGASRLDAFLTVTLSMARGGVVAAAVLAFARSVGEFGATIVLAGNVEGETRTLPVAVFQEIQSSGSDGVWRLAALCAVLAAGALVASEVLARRARR
ncbi:MAG: molybdate ABC transporter permease subunit [Planctomycetes bacterium]|nr:molybdate ABC transporter permease subunit [Planctomycetota bacterium]